MDCVPFNSEFASAGVHIEAAITQAQKVQMNNRLNQFKVKHSKLFSHHIECKRTILNRTGEPNFSVI